MRLRLAVLALPALLWSASARAGPGDANADTLYLVGEFADPVCVFQHGMQGTAQKQCALVRGRVEQGMYFLDDRQHRLYTVIGQTHWQDPKQGFLDALGDTVAIRAKVWRYGGSAALAVTDVWPWRSQPAPVYRWWPWSWHASTVVGCALLALLYLLALGPWRRRLGGPATFERGRAAVFLSSLAVVLVSLNGPLHDLSDLYLFSTHMIQHLILAQVFPALFVLGLPPWLRQALLRPRAVGATWGALTRVPVGFVLYTVVFSIWHVPVLYNLMMRDHGFHVVMHLMVMGTATLMWWPIVGGDDVRHPISPGAQLLYLFLLGIPMMAVAVPIVFAGHPLYEWYTLAPRFLGLAAVDDQRLGGLIMWIPGTMFWWIVMTVVFFRWSSRERRPEDVLAPHAI